MSPKAHARIKFWTYTLVRIPKMVSIAVRVIWFAVLKNQEKLNAVEMEAKRFAWDRDYETIKEFFQYRRRALILRDAETVCDQVRDRARAAMPRRPE